MLSVDVRELHKGELSQALALCWEVFREFEAPDYTQDGVDEFYKSIHDDAYVARLRIYGAFTSGRLVGVLATRNMDMHLALFFVKGKYHRMGVGTALLKALLAESRSTVLTVNSSPYAVEIYHRLGFTDTDAEQNVNGLRYTPMELIVSNFTR